MTRTRLLLDSLLYHRRANFAVGLGAAVAAAVLAGALLVGDSLRGSLRDRADQQLAGYDHALVAGRFFRQDLAQELPGDIQPAIIMQGTVSNNVNRVGRVTVISVGPSEKLKDETPVPVDSHDHLDFATISQQLAEQLDVHTGSIVEVSVQKASQIPRSSALARRDTRSSTKSFFVEIRRILGPSDPMARFTLNPGPQASLNLIVESARLQQEIEQPERANVLLSPPQPLQPLQAELEKKLSLEDWGLKVHIPEKRQAYVSIESRRLLLEPAAVEAARKAAEETGCHLSPTFVYLANSIAANGAEIPYSVVAGIDPNDSSPLNPVKVLFADDEIVLVDWKDSPLKAKPGDQVTLAYFNPEIEGKIEEAKHTFRLKAIIPLEGAAADPDLVPEFPGITDKVEISKWDPPFPYDNKRIKPHDDRYWKDHRATPKAYITLNTARKIWGSRFGDTTSIRLLPKEGSVAVALPRVQESLRKHLDAKQGGFVFEPVREKARAAGQGSTDFGMLFLAFSFFLIVAAMMLVGLLFRLNLERRAGEIGLLRAAGFPLRTVRRLLLLEGLIVASIGSAIGLAAAIGFASAMLKILAALWPSAGVGSFLALHVSATSLVIGFAASVLMSELAVWWAIRGLSRIEPARLLKGIGGDESSSPGRSKWGPRLIVIGILGAIALMAMAPFMPPGEPQAGTFFGGGAMLLTGGMAAIWTWLKRPRRATVHALGSLGIRNATRNPTRSLLTAGLLASAAFLLVAVESFRREPNKDFQDKTGGSGGFPLLAETDSPVFIDLTGEELLTDIERELQKKNQEQKKAGDELDAKINEVRGIFASTTVYPFRLRAGDDASCLNLYQATRPKVLGVSDLLIDRGGFRFSATEAKTPEEKANPWLLLRQTGDTIPAFVEENTATWQLKKGLGDVIEIPDEGGQPVKLRIAGLLKDSVFQSEMLVGDAAFRKSFPRTEGFSLFLIEPKPGANASVVEKTFEENLGAYGLEVTPTADRVSSYLAVQNTYLTTFQLLGGFGLLLGVLGLAVVLLRNVWERRSELALLRAMGYRVGTLNRLVFMENSILLLLGLGAGALAALVSVAPHIVGGGSLPWGRLSLMLGAVLLVGLTSAAIAVASSVRTPIVEGLRKE